MFKAFLITLVIVIFAGSFISWSRRNDAPSTATTTPTVVDEGPVYDDATTVVLAIGETGSRQGVAITPTTLIGDSRCPIGVECVWAGKVEVAAMIVSGLGTSTDTFEIGTIITTEAENVKLVDATPYPAVDAPIATSSYRFVFEVTKRTDLDI